MFIRKFVLFEEISIGLLLTDAVGNSYIFSRTCEFPNCTKLFAVKAATAIVSAHVLISVCARYGVSTRVRSDRGTCFVNVSFNETVQ